MKVGMDHTKGSLLSNKEYIDRDLCKRKGDELPYKIVTDEVYGRHMIAARKIKAGEIVLEDSPITMGPACSSGILPVCLACCKNVNGDYSCSTCGWPMCSKDCEENLIHADQECRLFKERSVKVDSIEFNYDKEEPLYSVISPLRALALKQIDTKRWEMIWSLMSHNGTRRGEKYWTEKHKQIINLIRVRFGLVEFSEELIDTVLGIFLVNDFEITQKADTEFSTVQRSSIRGLFSIASIPNHSCICNTVHTFEPTNSYRMTVRASRNIEEGEDITHTYVDPLDPVLIRQELLNLGKFFHCQCPRCSDPTELKTYSSAMVCPKCKKGYLLPSDVTSTSADWKCNNCEVKMDPVKISRVSNAVKDHAEKLEYNPKSPDECSIPAHEAFLRKYGQVLHSNHVIMISVKYSLAKMYGRMLGYEATTLTDAQLKRKLELCEQVLDVFNIILPGNNRMRGVMLYELHLPLVMLANRSLNKGPGSGVNPKSIKAGLKKGLESLKSGLAILKLEPEGSFEAKIVEGSKDSVAELEEWLNTVSKAL